jgi:KDO2-lipid IV(A) lauroyltransferase
MLYRFLGRLPFPILYAVAWIAYLLLYHVAGYRKAVVKDNLMRAFPDQSERAITLLAKNFYRQLAQVGLEIARARYMAEDDFRQRVEIVNPELVSEASQGFSQPVIILTIHQGNWEWMLHGLSLALDRPLDPVYKPLHSPGADRFMREVRGRFGSRPLPMGKATRDILKRRREFRLLVMVADQSPIRRERSHWTQFMGGEAAFYLGAETIARATEYPVLFAQCRRRHRGHYQVQLHELARPPYDNNEHSLTERYVRMAERAIREEPESWLWSNRRWKRQRDRDTA